MESLPSIKASQLRIMGIKRSKSLANRTKNCYKKSIEQPLKSISSGISSKRPHQSTPVHNQLFQGRLTSDLEEFHMENNEGKASKRNFLRVESGMCSSSPIGSQNIFITFSHLAIVTSSRLRNISSNSEIGKHWFFLLLFLQWPTDESCLPYTVLLVVTDARSHLVELFEDTDRKRDQAASDY
ncbi:hypothetical protein HYC85_014787 [Camellia sinensis]|uniref:Uncharacterized protein n=1 Tax=Camellia sinensis TaxID=4442 RepID=A0A7J7H7C7_CAMSI|nr:hypothetical protein HYC85_014787 [Camellia sinensis]